MGYLYHDARAVSALGVGTFGTTVGHVFKQGEGGVDNVAIFDTFHVDNQPHATSIVLIGGVIKQAVIHNYYNLFLPCRNEPRGIIWTQI